MLIEDVGVVDSFQEEDRLLFKVLKSIIEPFYLGQICQFGLTDESISEIRYC